jgi:hypothetical protein
MVVVIGIEKPGIHFQDQNTEQYLNNMRIIIEQSLKNVAELKVT